MKEYTIGQVIETLFPVGFLWKQHFYWRKAKFEDASELLKNVIKTRNPKNIDIKSFNGYKDYKDQHDSAIKISKKFSKCIKNKYLLPPCSPFDLFAITSKILQDSGAYHHFEASYESKVQPFDHLQSGVAAHQPEKVEYIKNSDIKEWVEFGKKWKKIWIFPLFNADLAIKNGDINAFIEKNIIFKNWLILLDSWNEPLFAQVKSEEAQPSWWKAAFALHAISDRASADVGFKAPDGTKNSKIEHTSPWCKLANLILLEFASPNVDPEDISNKSYVESLSFADRDTINVLPKSLTAQLGCTMRGLSHNLAALPPRGKIRVGWTCLRAKTALKRNPVFNLLVVPYPYSIRSRNFHPVDLSGKHGPRWGKFTLDVMPNDREDTEFIIFMQNLLLEANKQLTNIHAVVLPELAVSRRTAIRLTQTIMSQHSNVEFLCIGVREHMNKPGKMATRSNGAYLAFFNNGKKVQDFFHQKHHRWRVDESQINEYDLAPSLDPSRIWWEDLRVVNRCLPFIVIRNKWTVTSLICEDLARNDPARSVVEAIGPNLVISLLMDGPQITSRWSSRYATVLAEDPGSSVLSVSSFGLIERSNAMRQQRGLPHSNSFALWRDDTGITQEIELDPGNHAVAMSLIEYPISDYTFDGRRDNRSVSLRLKSVRQIKSKDHEKYPPWGSSTHS